MSPPPCGGWPPTSPAVHRPWRPARAAQAGQRLEVVCRRLRNEPDAAAHVDKIADGPGRGPLTEGQMDLDGALVFACLLYLTGHQESVQFWW
ncbi:hypothetical protein BJ965_007694 [Streptomyces luteogriseus]|uniref:Uncharacterized protein n=1 Tax=Streptomyces luteogriseus TaxID=68233 RepID=A0A7W7GJQ1_9ACTN|nr:hypothetical protein [Streptomyces luteogriseus]MBB4717812.1 hypothetical protein [Streptomyces luteogriseus]